MGGLGTRIGDLLADPLGCMTLAGTSVDGAAPVVTLSEANIAGLTGATLRGIRRRHQGRHLHVQRGPTRSEPGQSRHGTVREARCARRGARGAVVTWRAQAATKQLDGTDMVTAISVGRDVIEKNLRFAIRLRRTAIRHQDQRASGM
jgi:hypothetical protein